MMRNRREEIRNSPSRKASLAAVICEQLNSSMHSRVSLGVMLIILGWRLIGVKSPCTGDSVERGVVCLAAAIERHVHEGIFEEAKQ